jgi:hypothetical protein
LSRRPTVIDRRATATDELVGANPARFEVVFERRVIDGVKASVLVQVRVMDELPDGDAMIEVADDIAEIEKNRPHAVVI